MNAFGLPDGTVRAAMALLVTAAAIVQWVTGHEITDFQKVVTTAAITYYFSARTSETATKQSARMVDLDAVDSLKTGAP